MSGSPTVPVCGACDLASSSCAPGNYCNGTTCVDNSNPTRCNDGGSPAENCLPCGTGSDCASAVCAMGICTGGAGGGQCDNDSQCAGGNAPGFSAACVIASGKTIGTCACRPIPDAAVPDGQPPADSSSVESGSDACVGPVITGISPTAGVANDVVTITGTQLGGTHNGVYFSGGVQGTVNSGSNDGMLLVQVPAGGGTGPIEIAAPPRGYAPCGSVFSEPFSYRAVTGVLPAQGLPGTLVTISGASLGGTNAIVQFNGVTGPTGPASTDSSVVATIPQGAGNAGPLTVQAGSDVLTAVANYPIQANITMTCVSTGGGGTNPGDTWPSTSTIHATGGTSASFFSAGFRGDLYTSVPGTLAANGALAVTGPADPPHATDQLTLTGTVNPAGVGSGTGSQTTALGTVTFTWTSVAR